MGFDKNVFVNCPFDEEYRPLLRPLLFTIIYLGFKPRIALEDNYAVLKGRGFSDRDVAELPIGELTQYMERWVTHRHAPAAGRSRRVRQG